MGLCQPCDLYNLIEFTDIQIQVFKEKVYIEIVK